MNVIRNVTVYCSSSKNVSNLYFDAAAELGFAIANAGWQLIYGGNNVGCMGALADAARFAKGRVMGITPQLLVEQGIADKQCDELIVTRDMRDRKALLESHGDAFITLPGGLGTLEEIFEIIVGKSLACHNKPIVILNINRFYDPLLAMIQHGVEQRFIRAKAQDYFHVSSSVDNAIQYLKSFNEQGDIESDAEPRVAAASAAIAPASRPA